MSGDEMPHYHEDVKLLCCNEAAELIGDCFDGCCQSCHEDADEWGYDLCYFRFNGIEYEVCCQVMLAYEEWLKKQGIPKHK